MNDDDCLVEQYELKKDSSFCVHFIGDIHNIYHISKCFRYCSFCEAKGMMQGDDRQPLIRKHGALGRK